MYFSRNIFLFSKVFGRINPSSFLILVFISFSSFIFSCDGNYGFGPDYHTARFKQNIGGVLICQARSEADLHNFTWDVIYTYEDPDKNIYDIGGGTFFDKDWEENEQLIKFRKWTILATGNDQNSEKLII